MHELKGEIHARRENREVYITVSSDHFILDLGTSLISEISIW